MLLTLCHAATSTAVKSWLCAGIQSRFEAEEVNEDEEGLAEPVEVQEFMQELGESDHR